MIKNIVFDLGNVLISFKPKEYLDKKNYPENIKAAILSDVFGSLEWQLIDSASITTQEAIDLIASRSSLSKEEISHVFNLRCDLMFPLDQNIRILPELKKRGYKLYYLSNFPIDIIDKVRSEYYFFKYFTGGIISAEVKCSKPDIRIYEILLEKYSLIPGECLFIDDLHENVKGAENAGISGITTFGSLDISEVIENVLNY
jgi:glucose-1-phosphatase